MMAVQAAKMIATLARGALHAYLLKPSLCFPASALPVEAPPAFLDVAHSATGKLSRDRLDARGAARRADWSRRRNPPT
jgi:hypothetical protein